MTMDLKKKIYLWLIIFGLLTLCLIILIIYPVFGWIKESSQEIISQKQRLASLQDRIESLENFKKLYPTIKPNLEKIDGLFINPEAPIGFIGFLEKTASHTQVLIEISAITLRETKKDPWPFLGFQIRINGSFPKFLRFLEKLEAGPYLIEIQSLDISRLSEQDVKLKQFEGFSAGDIRASLSIKAFSKPR